MIVANSHEMRLINIRYIHIYIHTWIQYNEIIPGIDIDSRGLICTINKLGIYQINGYQMVVGRVCIYMRLWSNLAKIVIWFDIQLCRVLITWYVYSVYTYGIQLHMQMHLSLYIIHYLVIYERLRSFWLMFCKIDCCGDAFCL